MTSRKIIIVLFKIIPWMNGLQMQKMTMKNGHLQNFMKISLH